MRHSSAISALERTLITLAKQPLFRTFASRRLVDLRAAAPGLVACESSDGVVLSKLGLHISALNCGLNINTKEEALAYTLSLASTGSKVEAVDAAISAAERWPKLTQRLAIAISTVSPIQAMKLASCNSDIVTSSLAWKCGDLERSKVLLSNYQENDLNAYLLAANQSRMSNDFNISLTLVNQMLARQKLEPIFIANEEKWIKGYSSNVQIQKVDGPLISVLMPVKNIASFIPTAIDSVLNQTWRRLELIIVDDGSTDGTGELAEEAAESDNRIQVIRIPQGCGTYAARNIALKSSQGIFVTCHDGDDWSHPRKLELQANLLLKHKTLIATSSCWVRVDESGFYFARQTYPLIRWNPSSLMFRRKEALEHAGFFDSVKSGADCEYAERLRLYFGTNSVYTLRKTLSFGSHRSNSLMTATGTGIGKDGWSRDRLGYWDAWRKWHGETFANQDFPCLPMIQKSRLFPAPEAIITNANSIEDIES